MSLNVQTSRRGMLAFLAAGSGIALLAACGQGAVTMSPTTSATQVPAGQTGSGAAGQQPAGKAAEIHVNFRTGGDAEWQQKLIPRFQATHPHIKVVLDVLPAEPEYWAKVQALHATGQVGDFIWASLGNFKNFADRGILGSLDAVVARDHYDLGDYLAPGIANMTWNGKLFGMPWGAHLGNCAVLFNADLLANDGIAIEEATASYENLYQAAVQLTKTDGGKRSQFGFIPAGGQIGMNNVIRAFGGEFYDKAGEKLTLDTPQATEAVTWLQKMWRDASVTFGGGLQTNELFANGKIAMASAWYGSQFDPGEKAINGRFSWDIALMPKGPGNVVGTQLTINGIAMSSATRQPEATWEYMKYMLEPETQVEIVSNGGGRPAVRRAVIENPDLMTKMKAHKVFAPLYETAMDWPEPANHRWPEFNTAVDQVFGPVWTGQATLDAGLKSATAKLQEILSKPKA